ncbi:Occludin/ELL family protein [Synechococcus sp. Cruz CV12-2-Slac-r]|nr:Occludin/ELL family protein [Synechococcus sp. Cruz CV12-2-Slac-r]
MSILFGAGLLSCVSALAGPVVCTTSFEAPSAANTEIKSTAVEVTRCGLVQTTNDLIEQRFFSYSSPYARGIDITHQITDILGISMGGGDGTKVMGFGFPDQTIVWDGSAVENTTKALMQEQSNPIPLRVRDLPSSMGK